MIRFTIYNNGEYVIKKKCSHVKNIFVFTEIRKIDIYKKNINYLFKIVEKLHVTPDLADRRNYGAGGDLITSNKIDSNSYFKIHYQITIS